jgi:DNA-binding NarL/FixJ family response regulator
MGLNKYQKYMALQVLFRKLRIGRVSLRTIKPNRSRKEKMKTRVSIADDHPLIINGLKQILMGCEDIDVVSTYANGQELLDGLTVLQPDVLLLDIQMPYATGDEVAPKISRQYDDIKIIALTNQDNTFFVKTMLKHGVMGYVLKSSGADTIVEAIRTVMNGAEYIDPLLKEKVLQETLRSKKSKSLMPQLTRREKEVLDLIASNCSSQEIADQLYVSKRTIDNHRLSLLLKFGVKNSATLIRKAIELGLINQ